MVDIPWKLLENRFGRWVPLLLLFSGIFAVGLVFYWGNQTGPVTRLEWEGLVALQENDLNQRLGFTPGQPLQLGIDWEAKLLTHPRIAQVRIQRSGQGMAVVRIKERIAEFVLHIDNSLYEVDDELNILSTNQVLAEGLIVISGQFQVQGNKIVGRQISDITDQMRLAVQAYPALQSRISELVIEKDGDYHLYLVSPNTIHVFLGNTLNLLTFRKLYAAIAYMEAESVKVTSLDLRGEDAIYH